MTEPPVVFLDADLEDLIPTFMQRRRNEVVTLRERLAKGELEMIRIMGHTLKGTAGGYGFEQLSEIGAALEKAAMADDRATIQSCADEMEEFLTNVRIEFR